MFTWLNKQGVQSDRGFAVQRTGRFEAEYSEGGKVVTVEIESGVSGGLPCVIVDPSAFKHWDGSVPNSRIAPDERAQIFQNFREAMEFQGLLVVVEAGESSQD